MPISSNPPPPRISEVAPRFLTHARVELQFGAQTLEKYEYCLKRIERLIGDLPVAEITIEEVTALKSHMLARGIDLEFQAGEIGLRQVLQPEVVVVIVGVPPAWDREVLRCLKDPGDGYAGLGGVMDLVVAARP